MMQFSNVTCCAPGVAVDDERVCVDEAAAAVQLGDGVLLHQVVDAPDTTVRDVAAAVEGDAVVDGYRRSPERSRTSPPRR